MHVLANYPSEGKEKEKKTSWGGDIVSRGTGEPQAPTQPPSANTTAMYIHEVLVQFN